MKKDYSHISFVLDKSGSMAYLFNDTVGGFNSFVKSQKEAEGTATFSLTQFSTDFTLTHSFKDIQEVPDLDATSYRTGGGTALYDAIGLTIKGCGKKLADMDEADRPEKVVIVILTDGEENSSREYSFTKIQEMIKEQSEVYKWEFVFLGANLDAEVLGSSLGVKAGNSMIFAANAAGVKASYDTMCCKMTTFRGLSADAVASYQFFDENDKQAQTNAGA